MKRIRHKLFLLIVSYALCGLLPAHPRGEDAAGWVSTLEGIEALEAETKSVALDIKVAGDRKLVDALVEKFPNLRELKIYSFPHEVHPSLFQTLGNLKKLKRLELSGDARLSEEDFERIGGMVHLRHLSFSLP